MSATVAIEPMTVRVARGSVIWRHGRCWTPGQTLQLSPDDGARQLAIGSVERVR